MSYKNKKSIGIIGLGYVGLPLALEFSKFFSLVGYDKSLKRINELKKKIDSNNESSLLLKKNKNIIFTNNSEELSKCNVFIVTVPTPVLKNNVPDLSLLIDACKIISKHIKKGSLIIFESTVYPGCTENICVPILEKFSKLKLNKDFYCGYSPERINPGDKKNNFKNIVKIVSGSNLKIREVIKNLYNKVFKKIYLTKDIKIAESAKVIENIQRDLNIALANELSIIFKKLKIDTREVIEAAGTKWNFMKFYPGLVGGHCISVDPYYLTHIARINNYNPKVILSGRKINNFMKYELLNRVLSRVKKLKKINKKISFLIMGITYKENVSDLRNSQAVKITEILLNKNFKVDVFDPKVSKKNLQFKLKKVKIRKKLTKKKYDVILILSPHEEIKKLSKKKIIKMCKKNFIIFDLKGYLNLRIKEYLKL